MSPTIKSGTISPVDSLAPKARAISVTMIMAMPLIPALETPITKDAVKAKTQEKVAISDCIDRSTFVV